MSLMKRQRDIVKYNGERRVLYYFGAAQYKSNENAECIFVALVTRNTVYKTSLHIVIYIYMQIDDRVSQNVLRRVL